VIPAHRHLITAVDGAAWQRRFLQQWPAGSDAPASHFQRSTRGPAYHVDEAVRTEE
jgi:hypothetical protein